MYNVSRAPFCFCLGLSTYEVAAYVVSVGVPTIFCTMDRRTALALRQAYRRDAALLLQSYAASSDEVCTSSGPSAKASSKDAKDVLQRNQPAKDEYTAAAAAAASSPFVPPPQDMVTNGTAGGIGESALHALNLAGIGRNLVLRASREVPPPPLKGRRGTTAANTGVDDGQFRPEHYCAPCGALFFLERNETKTCGGENGDNSGISTTTVVRVRSISRGRTRRRRAARVRARQAAQDAAQRKDRGGGRQWGGESKSGQSADGAATGAGRACVGHGHAVATYTQADMERRKANAQLYNVRDGTKHHCVVYTCGNCGHKKRLGGIDVASRERRRKGNVQDHQDSNRDSTSIHRKKKSQTKGLRTAANVSAEQMNAQTDAIGGDFISLAPVSKAEPPKKQDASAKANKKASSYSFQDKASQSKKAASANRLDQSSNRKRKKSGGLGAGSLSGGGKKNAGKKSKLMDFLSSLNG